MKKYLAVLFAMAGMIVGTQALAADVTFSWLPNPENQLVEKYIVYWTNDGGQTYNSQDCGTDTSEDGRVYCTVKDFPTGPWEASATAYSYYYGESDKCDPIAFVVPEMPTPVQGLKYKIEISISVSGVVNQ
jgi:hypothetical protein